MYYSFLLVGVFIIFAPLLMQAHSLRHTDSEDQGIVFGVSTTKQADQLNAYEIYVEARILEEINAIRISHGLDRLELKSGITTASRRHSDELASLPQLEANAADPIQAILTPQITHTGTTFGATHNERIAAYDIQARVSGENIIAQPILDIITLENDLIVSKEPLPLDRVIHESIQAWMASPEHRANILLSDYTHTGIGAVVSGQHVIITQVFVRLPS